MDRRFQLALIEAGIDTITRLSLLTKIERTKLNRIINGVALATAREKQAIAQTLGRAVETLLAESEPPRLTTTTKKDSEGRT